MLTDREKAILEAYENKIDIQDVDDNGWCVPFSKAAWSIQVETPIEFRDNGKFLRPISLKKIDNVCN